MVQTSSTERDCSRSDYDSFIIGGSMRSCDWLKMTKRRKGDLTTLEFQIIYLWIVVVLPIFTAGSADQRVCLGQTDELSTCYSPPPRAPECPSFVHATIECPSDIHNTCGCSDVYNASYSFSVAYHPYRCNAITYTASFRGPEINVNSESCSWRSKEPEAPICSGGFKFPVGTTEVKCQAFDFCHRVTECSFIVTAERDTEPPIIECSYVANNVSCINISCNVADNCSDLNDITIHCKDLDGNVLKHSGPICIENMCTNVTCTATDRCGNSASDIFPVETEPCPSSVVLGEFGILTFPPTHVNQKAESEERCFDYVTYKHKPRATRRCRCDVSAVWEEPILAVCPGISEEEDSDLLRKVSRADVTAENVTHYSYDLLQATKYATDINAEGLQAVAIALQKIVAVMAPSEEVTSNVARIVDDVLNVPEFIRAPTIILDALEQQITLFQTQGNQNNLTITGDNLAVVALRIPESSLDTGLGFGTVTSPSAEENESASKDLIQTMVFFDRSDIPRATLDASIVVPSDVLNFVPPSVREKGTVPVTFLIFQNTKLFQSSALRFVRGNGGRLLIGTRVISATVEGAIIEELPEGREVETTFLELNVIHANEKVDKRTCVFWNKTGNGGRWSSEGCRREYLSNVNRIRCLCNHLTSFAVLLDISGDAGHHVLDVLSMIGCIISIICLVITLVTYLGMKHLRKRQPQQILINLCFSLLGLYFVFVVGIDRRNPTMGCVIIGFFIHFFLLSSMSWMTAEAVNMYFLFVKVYNTKVPHFMPIASLCTYGFPLGVCIATVVVDPSLYLGDDTYCFVKPGPAIYYGVLLIVAILLAVNFITFGFVMKRLTCRRFSHQIGQADHREKWRRVQNAVAISILLGLTWLFGFIAIGGARLYFNILFLIFNSLQGFFIFFFFCLRQNEVFNQWKQWMHCCPGKNINVPEQHNKKKYSKKNIMTTSSRDGPTSFEMSSNKEITLISSETLSTGQ